MIAVAGTLGDSPAPEDELSKTKQSPLLLLPEDEVALHAAVVAEHGEVRILDSSGPWASAEAPPVCAAVTDTGTAATIWHPGIHPVLPVQVRSNGAVYGPEAGPVVQWIRSRHRDGVLTAGRWAAVLRPGESPEMVRFVDSLWRILRRETANDLIRRNRSTGEEVRLPAYRIGQRAGAAARAGRLVLVDGAMELHPRSG